MNFERSHNHTLQIKNIEDISDVDELATIVITNGVNGKNMNCRFGQVMQKTMN